MASFIPVYIYFGIVAILTLLILGATGLFPAQRTDAVKYMPYESGIQTEAHLFQERFPLRHYLVGLIFLVLDVEVIFLYPWAVIAKTIGPFAFYEMLFFLLALVIGFIYIWRQGGLKWD